MLLHKMPESSSEYIGESQGGIVKGEVSFGGNQAILRQSIRGSRVQHGESRCRWPELLDLPSLKCSKSKLQS